MQVAVGLRGLALAGLLFAASVTAWPQAAAPRAPTAERPRIALVLSGGGARGGAHLGVLKVLEEQRVPVDIIVGTSSGAIVGASYASGMPLAEIETGDESLSSETIFRDLARDDVPLRRKADDAVNYIGPEVGIGPGGLELPKGAVAGVALEAVLRRLTARQRDSDFDKLPIRFRAVATDVTTSDMVVLDRGSLSTAIRASMAIPAVVTPVEIDGRLLVDGGVVRNLPIDVARSLGAQVVIAVNIGTPLLERKEITSLLSVSDQSDAHPHRQQRQPVAEGADGRRRADHARPRHASPRRLRSPDRSGGGRRGGGAPGGGSAGALAGRRRDAMPRSRRAHRHRRAAPTCASRRCASRACSASTKTWCAPRWRPSRAACSTPPPPTTTCAASTARGDFERVSYFLTELPGGGHAMTTDVGEKAWGPHYLRLGFGLSTDFEGTRSSTCCSTHRWTWLNRLGAEWRNDVQIGHTERLRTEWHQPLTSAQRWFVAGHAELARDPFDFFDDEGRRVARFRRDIRQVGVDVGVPFGNVGEARLGLVRGRVKLGTDIEFDRGSDVVAPSNIGGAVLRLRLDALDSVRLPRAGYALDVRLFRSYREFGADEIYSRLSIGAQGRSRAGRMRCNGPACVACDQRRPAVSRVVEPGRFLAALGLPDRPVHRTRRTLRPPQLHLPHRPARILRGHVGRRCRAKSAASATRCAGPTPRKPVMATRCSSSWTLSSARCTLAYGRASSSNQAVYLFLGQP